MKFISLHAIRLLYLWLARAANPGCVLYWNETSLVNITRSSKNVTDTQTNLNKYFYVLFICQYFGFSPDNSKSGSGSSPQLQLQKKTHPHLLYKYFNTQTLPIHIHSGCLKFDLGILFWPGPCQQFRLFSTWHKTSLVHISKWPNIYPNRIWVVSMHMSYTSISTADFEPVPDLTPGAVSSHGTKPVSGPQQQIISVEKTEVYWT